MILVTGATGFVGRAFVERLASDTVEQQIIVAVRNRVKDWPNRVCEFQIQDVNSKTDWRSVLQGIDVVVHLAARVHVMNEKRNDPLAEFRKVNVAGTANLARQAAALGVRRFVFLSSVKVNGEFTKIGSPFQVDVSPNPQDPYGVSKYEAELVLRQIAAETGMQVVIIRPPLVYGPGVKANFDSMMRWLDRGLPLPLGSITRNQRSLVALGNLVDLIVTCLKHPAAANQTFLVSDDEDLSTAALLKRMGDALGRPARLLPVPVALLKLGALVINKPGIYQRLCGSLQLDITQTRRLLGWTPPVSVDEGLRLAAQGVHR